jgi:hypothetical protein
MRFSHQIVSIDSRLGATIIEAVNGPDLV